MMDYEKLREQFPHLSQLLGAYLSQDFSIYGPTLESAVGVYLDDSDPEEVSATRAEIAKFLSAKDVDLDSELRCLCSDYSHEPDRDAREHLNLARWDISSG